MEQLSDFDIVKKIDTDLSQVGDANAALNNADIHLQDENGAGILHYVTAPEMLIFFIQRGVNKNLQDKQGHTALYQYVENAIRNISNLETYNKILSLIETLLSAGALIDLPDNDGMTPLYLATHTKRPDEKLIKLLVHYGANVRQINNAGEYVMRCYSVHARDDFAKVSRFVDQCFGEQAAFGMRAWNLLQKQSSEIRFLTKKQSQLNADLLQSKQRTMLLLRKLEVLKGKLIKSANSTSVIDGAMSASAFNNFFFLPPSNTTRDTSRVRGQFFSLLSNQTIKSLACTSKQFEKACTPYCREKNTNNKGYNQQETKLVTFEQLFEEANNACAVGNVDLMVECYDYCLDFAVLNNISENQMIGLVDLLSHYIPHLLKFGYIFLIHEKYKKLSNILKNQGKQSEQALENLNEIQLKNANSLAQANTNEYKKEKNSDLTESQFSTLKQQFECAVSRTSELIHRERGLQQFYSALEKLIHLILQGHSNIEYSMRYKYMTEAMQYSCSGLSVAMQKNDTRAISHFENLVDIIFAHFYYLHMVFVSGKPSFHQRKTLFSGKNQEKQIAYERMLIAADILFGQAVMISRDTDQPQSAIMNVLEKAQELYVLVKDRAIVDANFIVYGIKALTRLNIITQCCLQLKLLTSIDFNRQETLVNWKQHRATLKDNRFRAHSRLNTTRIEETLSVVSVFNQQLTHLIEDIFNESIKWMIADLPFEYAFLILGSLAREEACPFSDLEYALLVSDDGMQVENIQTIETILRFFELIIISMGESPTSNLGLTNMLAYGFQLDGNYVPLKNSRMTQFKLLGTPSMLLSQVNDPYLGNMLLNTKALTVSSKGQLLYNQYLQNINQIDSATKNSIGEEIVNINHAHIKPFSSASYKVNVKTEILHLPVLLLAVLNLYESLNLNSTIERLQLLEEKTKSNSLLAELIKLTLLIGMRLRFLTHLHYGEEYDELKLNESVPFLNEEILTILMSLRHAFFPTLCQLFETLNSKEPFSFTNNAIKISPDIIPALLVMADDAMDASDFVGALKYYSFILEVDSQHAAAITHYNNLVLRLGPDYQEQAFSNKQNVNENLLSAAKNNDIYACSRLLFDKKANILYQNTEGFCVLHLTNSPALIQFFLNLGANMEASLKTNRKDYPGYTPLHWHISQKHIDVIKVLLMNGANIRARDASNNILINCSNNLAVITEVSFGQQAAYGMQAWNVINNQQIQIKSLVNDLENLQNNLLKLNQNEILLEQKIEELDELLSRSNMKNPALQEAVAYRIN